MRARAQRVISDGIAYEVTDILKGVITEGTGSRIYGLRLPGRRQDRHHRGPVRRLVRRLHARLSTAVWVGHPTSRASTGFGGPTAGPIWHSYMEAAHGSYCGDFPQPQNPVQFSNWSGSHTVSAPSTHTFGGTGTSKPAPSSGADNGKYPPSLYAPGAGQGPAPSPRGQRRRRRAASGQPRRRRPAAARARPRVSRAPAFWWRHTPLTRQSGRRLRSVARYLHCAVSGAPAARIRHRCAARGSGRAAGRAPRRRRPAATRPSVAAPPPSGGSSSPAMLGVTIEATPQASRARIAGRIAPTGARGVARAAKMIAAASAASTGSDRKPRVGDPERGQHRVLEVSPDQPLTQIAMPSPPTSG